MHRNTDGAGLVGNRPGDSLPNPPRCISGELESLAVLKLLDSLDQADVAFLNQIKEVQPPIGIFFCDGYHEPEVGADQAVLGILHHLLAVLDLRGVQQDIIAGVFELVLYLPQILLRQLEFPDKVLDRITGQVEFFFDFCTPGLGCKVSPELSQLLG
ncbi:hypothetical protein DSECCO2_370300 [anaerobic digester metagenome]